MSDENGIATALAELQKELPHIGKKQSADTGSYTYDYADLTDISTQVMPLLGKHGLAFMAKPTLKDGSFVLAYSLLHVSGDREDGEFPLSGNNAQAIGSAITYARRYVLCAVTGVAPGGSDDDGRAAVEHQRRERAKPDSLALARQKLAAAWKANHGSLDVKAIEDAFAQWSEGEIFAEATPERLHEFAAVVAADSAAAELDDSDRDPDGAADHAEAVQQELPDEEAKS